MDFVQFERMCPYCNQMGVVINPEFLRWQINECVGKEPNGIITKCPICNGTRLIPTELGKDILELVRKYEYSI